jgi:hypothetical protein
MVLSAVLPHFEVDSIGARSHLINLARERATDVYQPRPEIRRQIGVYRDLS